jgi:hypothetical protein
MSAADAVNVTRAEARPKEITSDRRENAMEKAPSLRRKRCRFEQQEARAYPLMPKHYQLSVTIL